MEDSLARRLFGRPNGQTDERTDRQSLEVDESIREPAPRAGRS